MIEFSAPRFSRVIRNDALRLARPLVFATVALFGLTVILYLFNHQRLLGEEQAFSQGLFGTVLIVTGMLLTGIVFQDMHHRLDRYQYLMLPISTFERLLSRFLLTGPLFVLFGTLAFMVFDFAGKQMVLMYWDVRLPLFSPFTAQTKWLLLSYMLVHLVMLIGSICFRTHAFLRTILFLLALFIAMLLAENMAERIFFPELFSWSQFQRLEPLPVEVVPGFTVAWMNTAFVVGVSGWLIYIAYACLRDHEASDGV